MRGARETYKSTFLVGHNMSYSVDTTPETSHIVQGYFMANSVNDSLSAWIIWHSWNLPEDRQVSFGCRVDVKCV